MGCAASRRIDNEERVQRCKERRKLMKQLLVLRSEFVAAQVSYLQSLKNTGITLRQFTESESLEEEELLEILAPSSSSSSFDTLPPPPLSETTPLPPPPPPPPPFSPDDDSDKEEEDGPLPPPLISSSSWNFWDPFDGPSSMSSPLRVKAIKAVAAHDEVEEEEEWVETNTEFEEEGKGEVEAAVKEKNDEKAVSTDAIISPFSLKPVVPVLEQSDGNSPMSNFNYTNLVGNGGSRISMKKKKKKSVSGIIREIDDYFLKACDSGRCIALLIDINRGDSLHQNFGDSMRKNCKSAKVFNALSWSRSSKSLHSSKDVVECNESSEPCKPGAHCITLDKIYVEEERLYKEVKEEENAKMEYERKMLLLQKQEANDQDLLKTEEIRSNIENLQVDIVCLQESISKTCSTIVKLRDEELQPQLIELSLRLTHMWRTMHECHGFQNHIAQQLNKLSDLPSIEPTTDYHRQSTVQLQNEVNAWYINFCNLLQSQREYIRVLNRWVQLTACLLDVRQSDCLSGIHTLCEEWNLSLDRLSEKVVSEAIKNFVTAIHSIVLQQAEERNLQKKKDRLEKKLQKELNTLSEMEKKFEVNLNGDVILNLSPNHPLSVKRAKTELFKKRVEDEKAKYLNSVQVSGAMTLNNLQSSLPSVFQALTEFSNACALAFESINSHTELTLCHGDE